MSNDSENKKLRALLELATMHFELHCGIDVTDHDCEPPADNPKDMRCPLAVDLRAYLAKEER